MAENVLAEVLLVGRCAEVVRGLEARVAPRAADLLDARVLLPSVPVHVWPERREACAHIDLLAVRKQRLPARGPAHAQETAIHKSVAKRAVSDQAQTLTALLGGSA